MLAMKTSVILVTKNRMDEVIRFTQSLYNQIELPDEFIIVDSSDAPLNSNKKFVNALRRKPEKIDFHVIHSECGLPAGRNIGVKESSGDIIYFFDDDVILEPDYVQIMNKTFNDNPDYMGGMGAFLKLPEQTFRGKIGNLIRGFFLLQRDHGNGKFQKSGFPRHPYGINSFMEVEVLGGCFMSYRRDVFREFSFDENLEGSITMEDVDFSRRVSYKYKLFYNPQAKLEHRHAVSGRGNIRENSKRYLTCHRYLFCKNFPSKSKLSIIPHWWSILGLIIYSLIGVSKETTKGYVDGLKLIIRKRKEPLCNWVAWPK